MANGNQLITYQYFEKLMIHSFYPLPSASAGGQKANLTAKHFPMFLLSLHPQF